MKTTSKTILFFGNERLATGVSSQTPILKSLIDRGYKIPALIVSQDSLAKSRSSRQLEVIEVAKANSIEVLSFASLKNAASDINKFGARAAVLVAYGKIIPRSVLDLFPVGIINVHPSLLPRHRGPTPLESTILGGDKETGVSIMRIGVEMDSGPIYAQQKISLDGHETKQALADKLNLLGSEMLVEHLDSIIDGSLLPVDQPDTGATYDKLISKQDGEIDWNLSAEQIERQVRAYGIWPKSKSKLGDTEITVLEAHAIPGKGQIGTLLKDAKLLGVYTSDGTLVLDKLLPAGKKEMSGQSFLAGYRAILNR